MRYNEWIQNKGLRGTRYASGSARQNKYKYFIQPNRTERKKIGHGRINKNIKLSSRVDAKKKIVGPIGKLQQI